VTGSNSIAFTYTGNDSADISQVEIEVVYNRQRVMPVPSPVHMMPMLGITSQSLRVDHLSTDPAVYTSTAYLYGLGSTATVNWSAAVISTETPWLSVSPAAGQVTSPLLGGGVQPLVKSVDFSGLTTDSDGEVGVIRITGGNMPLYFAVLAVNDGSNTRPQFLPPFTSGLNTTFDKSAIPDYHGAGTGTPTPGATTTPGPTPCGLVFTDVPPDYWAYAYINYMACGGIISGYADGTFRPGNNTTRGQVAKMIVLAERWSINTSGGPHFTDVAPGSTFYDFVETAYNHGVISGYANGTFKPGNSVTRAQLSKIVALARGWPANTSGGPHFSDVPATHAFYTYVETAYNHGAVSGYADGTFRPGNNTTRAQFSKVLYLALTGP
jgi:hypothetical protein